MTKEQKKKITKPIKLKKKVQENIQNTKKKNHKIIQKSKKITKFEKNTKTEHVNIYP